MLDKLRAELKEAQAAKPAHQAVTRELADCHDRIDAMTRERDTLTEYIERCVALREQIWWDVKTSQGDAVFCCFPAFLRIE